MSEISSRDDGPLVNLNLWSQIDTPLVHVSDSLADQHELGLFPANIRIEIIAVVLKMTHFHIYRLPFGVIHLFFF